MVKKRPCPSGVFYGQEATMPEAIPPVKCMFGIKTGAFYGQDVFTLEHNDF
jgi:hypothetical protein